MAKRFIDTGFFDSPSIRRLPALYKLFWLYLFTNCDHAGVWIIDFPKASFMCGSKIKREVAEEKMKGKFIEIDGGNRWFLPGFIVFQYPNGLNPKNSAHRSALRILNSFNLTADIAPILAPTLAAIGSPYIKPLHEGNKDKDKDIVMVIEMDKVEDKAKEILIKLNEATGCDYSDASQIIQNLQDGKGKTVEQHIHIIEVKRHDPHFRDNPQFMAPGTLFGKNFDTYRNQRIEMFKKKDDSSPPPGDPKGDWLKMINEHIGEELSVFEENDLPKIKEMLDDDTYKRIIRILKDSKEVKNENN